MKTVVLAVDAVADFGILSQKVAHRGNAFGYDPQAEGSGRGSKGEQCVVGTRSSTEGKAWTAINIGRKK